MKLTILGSGTVDPQPHRASSGYYLNTEQGDLMLDCGAGTLRNGLRFQQPLATLKRLLLTHLHPDHTADLVPLLFARRYAPGDWQEREPLRLFGPEGTRAFVEALYAAWPSLRPVGDQEGVLVEEPQGGTAFEPWPGLAVTPIAVEHGDMKAFSYRIEFQGKTLAYSGDTRLCSGVKEAAKNADLFLCECSCFPRGCEPSGCRNVHLSWEDVAEICAEAGPKRVVLTHLYELVLNRDPGPLKPLRDALNIPVDLASDGAVYQL